MAAVLLADPHARAADQPRTIAISIVRNQFDPATASIEKGQTVVWTNNDDSDHTVVAADGSFTSGLLKHGDTYAHQFTAAGTVAYGDRLHPRMHGSIQIKAN